MITGMTGVIIFCMETTLGLANWDYLNTFRILFIQKNQYRWMVRLATTKMKHGKLGTFMCGGALISSKVFFMNINKNSLLFTQNSLLSMF